MIGMAGGDGSQALVASVAADRHPHGVVPAGTRNHLALDLGLDRDDVVGAMDAFGDGRGAAHGSRRRERPRLREQRLARALRRRSFSRPNTATPRWTRRSHGPPKVLGPARAPFDLRFAGPDGAPHDGAHVIQVSNNPYRESIAGFGSRPRLDTGRLGIVTLVIANDRAAAAFLSALAAGRLDRYQGYTSWSSTTFEVMRAGRSTWASTAKRSSMDPPLVFSMRPEPLRVRIPRHAIGYSPAAMAMDPRSAAKNLGRIAAGRPASGTR